MKLGETSEEMFSAQDAFAGGSFDAPVTSADMFAAQDAFAGGDFQSAQVSNNSPSSFNTNKAFDTLATIAGGILTYNTQKQQIKGQTALVQANPALYYANQRAITPAGGVVTGTLAASNTNLLYIAGFGLLALLLLR